MKLIKLLVAISLIAISLNADSYRNFTKHLENKNYFEACLSGKQIFLQGERDEKLLSAIGQACLDADYIFVVSMIQSRLRESTESRNNAVIFSSIVLQKRLIYQFMYDDIDISSLGLPISEHPLSHTFVAIRDKSYTLESKSPKIIKFKKDDENYKVYIDYEANGRIIIEITDSTNKTTTHRYL